MPTYAYKCFACGHEFEEFQKITDDAIKTCPKCAKDEVKRLMSAPAFHLKGSGWYKTDYGSVSSSSAPSGDGGDKSVKESTETPAKSDSDKNTVAKQNTEKGGTE